MKILVTGSHGYIGTVLTPLLAQEGHEVDGLDSDYFEEPLVPIFEDGVQNHFKKDVRDLKDFPLTSYDAVIHLAALSNDPIGELNPNLTIEINQLAPIELARMAKNQGVKRFIYISTQSIYGVSDSEVPLNEDAPKNPQTAYASTKWIAEQEILSMSSEEFTPTALRPSTVFGWSPRLRSDIVFNNLLLSGIQNEVINVHSDGTPWRPIVHVEDLCISIIKVLNATIKKISGEAFNIGNLNGNFQVKEIAAQASTCLGGIPIAFKTEDIKDPRSYRVSFLKAQQILGFEANANLQDAGMQIIERISKSTLLKSELLSSHTNRLARIKELIEKGLIDDSLRYKF
jgi:nucleoside-diphosphate-sugar epimerase